MIPSACSYYSGSGGNLTGASAGQVQKCQNYSSKISSLVKNGKFSSLLVSRMINLSMVHFYRYCHHQTHKKRVFSLTSDGESQYQFWFVLCYTYVQLDCKTLQVSENCDENQVRSSFIRLTKIYHPDSSHPESSTEKFYQLDTAYKNMLQKFADERHNQSKIEGEFGLYYDAKKHTKPETDKNLNSDDDSDHNSQYTKAQHRQFLNYDGFTAGSPYQREKQYEKYRAAKAIGNVYDHRVKKLTQTSGAEETALAKDQKAAKKIKTSFGMDRLVEDMIQESMARGEFDNLSSAGKPLKHDSSYNPYIDFTTHKINQVLIENGFAPEWILLEKEIRQEIRDIRSGLQLERHTYEKIMSAPELLKWEEHLARLTPSVDQLNSKIQKYNLLVPSLYKQIIGLQLEKEGKKALDQFSDEIRIQQKAKIDEANERDGDREASQLNKNGSANYLNSQSGNFLDVLFSLVRKPNS